MKQRFLKRAFILFETFKSHNLTTADLDNAEMKSIHLNDKQNDFRLLIQMAKDVLAGNYKMSRWNTSVIVATIIYVVSPIDAIPDFLPILGWLDDSAIIVYAVAKLSEEMKKYKKQTKI